MRWGTSVLCSHTERDIGVSPVLLRSLIHQLLEVVGANRQKPVDCRGRTLNGYTVVNI